MTVLSDPVKNLAKIADFDGSGYLEVWTSIRDGGADGILTDKPVHVPITSAGITTPDLVPGPAFFRLKLGALRQSIEGRCIIPTSGPARVMDLIAASLLIPEDTPADLISRAVQAYLAAANIELAYAEVSGKMPIDISGTFTDAPGMAITFATGVRPAIVECYLSGVYGNGSATWGFRVVNTAGAILAEGVTNTSVDVGYPPSPALRFRVPANTPSTTYRLQTNRWVGSATGEFNTQERKAYLSAVSV